MYLGKIHFTLPKSYLWDFTRYIIVIVHHPSLLLIKIGWNWEEMRLYEKFWRCLHLGWSCWNTGIKRSVQATKNATFDLLILTLCHKIKDILIILIYNYEIKKNSLCQIKLCHSFLNDESNISLSNKRDPDFRATLNIFSAFNKL